MSGIVVVAESECGEGNDGSIRKDLDALFHPMDDRGQEGF